MRCGTSDLQRSLVLSAWSVSEGNFTTAGDSAGIEDAQLRCVGVYRFEDLRVWQAAKQQCDRVGAQLKRPTFQRDAELSGQMNDAALSVLFNISEGFLRRRDKETLQFLRYAFASNGELKSAYYAAEGRDYLPAAETADLIRLNESIAKMLRRWQATMEPGQTPKLVRSTALRMPTSLRMIEK
jgi:four helix bundle protein